jgi:hypothetical protein
MNRKAGCRLGWVSVLGTALAVALGARASDPSPGLSREPSAAGTPGGGATSLSPAPASSAGPAANGAGGAISLPGALPSGDAHSAGAPAAGAQTKASAPRDLISVKVANPPAENPPAENPPAENPIEAGGSFRGGNGLYDGAPQGTVTGAAAATPRADDRAFRANDNLLFVLLNYQADQNSVRQGESLTMAGIRYKPTFEFQYASWLSATITPKLWIAQGYADSRLGNFVPPQSLSLYESYLQAKPSPYFAFQVGALNQARLDTEILIGDSSFPATLEKAMIGGDRLSAELRAEQAIPTATTLSTNTTESEPTPAFFFESLIVDAKPVKWAELRLSASYFRFSDLPSVVAQVSETRGNSVDDYGPNNSHFRYDFEGYVYGIDGRLDLHRRVSALAGWKMIDNLLAPETYNLGTDGFLALDVRVAPEVSVKPRADVFFLESDAVPAYWLESFYGAQTNRTGYAGALILEFKKQKLSTGAHFMHYDPINPNQWQSSENLVFLEFTTRHDLF